MLFTSEDMVRFKKSDLSFQEYCQRYVPLLSIPEEEVVIYLTCRMLGIEEEDFFSSRRFDNVVTARIIASVLIKLLTGKSWPKIGAAINQKHDVVLYYFKQAVNFTDPKRGDSRRLQFEFVKEKIEEFFNVDLQWERVVKFAEGRSSLRGIATIIEGLDIRTPESRVKRLRHMYEGKAKLPEIKQDS